MSSAPSESLRIVALTDFFEPVIGGLERHVAGLAAEMARRGHQPVVVTLAGDTDVGEELAGVEVRRVTGLAQRALKRFYVSGERPFHPTLPDPPVVRALDRIVGEIRPHIVLAHSWIVHSYLPVKHRHDAPLIAYLHDYGLACARKTFFYESREVCTGPALRKCLACAEGQYGRAKGTALTAGVYLDSPMYRRIDHLIANSHATLRGVLSGPGMGGKRSDVVPPFVEPVSDDSGPRPAFLPPDDGFVLFVGALGVHKGIEVLLDAWSRLPDRPPLVLLGTPQVDTPTAFPEGVTVVEDVPHAQVMASFAHAGVAVVPSVWPEPFGKVAVEAMAASCPVVVSDVGGLSDIVEDERNGLLVPAGDTAALTGALARVLGDEALAERLREGGRERAEHYSVQRVVDEHERIYGGLLRAQARARAEAAA